MEVDIQEIEKEAKEQAVHAGEWLISLLHRIYTEGYEHGFKSGVAWIRGKEDDG